MRNREKYLFNQERSKGITLVALVITITLLLILASIATYSGVEVIHSSRFTTFTAEMKIMQNKVNELYQAYKNGDTINEHTGNDILNIGINIDERQDVKAQADKVFTEGESGITNQTGYRYFDKQTIQELKIEGIEQEFFINIEKRSVVSYLGIEYEEEMYYTLEQLPKGLYNVEYENPNTGKPTFDVDSQEISPGKWRMTVSNIQYNNYIDKWQVQYKLEGTNYWTTSKDLSFVVNTDGNYTIKIVNNEIESEEKITSVHWDGKVNTPKLLDGMSKIMFQDPTDTEKGKIIKVGETGFDYQNWYNYENKKWANSMTQDGSMWVWIPRYAYKITYNNASNKSQGGTIDVKFLIGTTDQYYDNDGNLKTAKRAPDPITEAGADTTKDYYVHPAFTDESNIEFANGGWDKELTGIWVAKFEAGYPQGNNNAPIKASSINYTQATSYVRAVESTTGGDATLAARNWLDGIYGETTTAIKYPTFQGTSYAMIYTNHNDVYNISKVLTEKDNIYGLKASSTDSHLMKNSEWGAVAYLGQSKYGLNRTNIYINNISLNSGNRQRVETIGKTGVDSIYAVTGCTTGQTDAGEKQTTIDKINGTKGNQANDGIYTWNQKNGQGASSTGTIYGIYDLSGGIWERAAAYVANNHENLKTYGNSIAFNGEILKTESTKYTTVYPYNPTTDNFQIENNETNINIASTENYKVNTKIFGDSIRETSINGTGSTSWNNDYSNFAGLSRPFFVHGGYFEVEDSAGIDAFARTDAISSYYHGFRVVLVANG